VAAVTRRLPARPGGYRGVVTVDEALLEARARVLHDLTSCGCATPAIVDLVDESVAGRRWWLDQWPDGAPYVACLVAQDVQEAMLEHVGRWPACPRHGEHELLVQPDLGEDPRWVCPVDDTVVAALGHLGQQGSVASPGVIA
jgi:hypothetical protein